MLPRASGGVRPCSTPQVKKSQTENKPGSSYEENKLFLPESRSGVTAFRLVSYFSELFLHAFLLRHPTWKKTENKRANRSAVIKQKPTVVPGFGFLLNRAVITARWFCCHPGHHRLGVSTKCCSGRPWCYCCTTAVCSCWQQRCLNHAVSYSTPPKSCQVPNVVPNGDTLNMLPLHGIRSQCFFRFHSNTKNFECAPWQSSAVAFTASTCLHPRSFRACAGPKRAPARRG